MRILITADENDVKDGIGKAYENFARKGCFNVTEKSTFKCTKVVVGSAIDDYFRKYYMKKQKEAEPYKTDKELSITVNLLLLCYGAKRDETINPWDVVMDDDFVENKEE